MPSFRLLPFLVLAACLGSCTSSDNPRSRSGIARAGLESTIVGPEGAQVTVPAGSLPSDTRITVSVAPTGRRPAGAVASPTFRMTPEGLAFDKPAIVSIPITPSMLPPGSTIDDVVIMRAPQASAVFVPLPTRRSGNAVEAVTEHFSDFVAVVLSGEGGVLTVCDPMCLATDSCSTCPLLCGLCVGADQCGNRRCEPAETSTSCPFDCVDPCGTNPCANGGICAETGGGAWTCTCTGGYSGPDCSVLPTVLAGALEWQRIVDPGTYDWTQADAYCTGLVMGGQADWRLPTRLEALSIVDYTVVSPAIDVAVFPGTPNAPLWTSTDASVVMPGHRWYVSGDDGSSGTQLATIASRVRCVRTVTPVSGGFVDNLNGTVTDSRTGLVWEQTMSSQPQSQTGAVSYCAALALAGATWRLPTVYELATLVDHTRVSPAIDTAMFANDYSMPTRTSTPWAPNSLASDWTVDMSTGAVVAVQQQVQWRVRCVR